MLIRERPEQGSVFADCFLFNKQQDLLEVRDVFLPSEGLRLLQGFINEGKLAG